MQTVFPRISTELLAFHGKTFSRNTKHKTLTLQWSRFMETSPNSIAATEFTKHKGRLWLPALVMLPLLAYDFWFFGTVSSGRTDVMAYIGDIRVIHQYTNYAIGFISLVLGLLISRLEEVRKYVGYVHVMPFIIALFSAAFCIMFIPVSYENTLISYVRFYWGLKIVLEQVVVVFTVYGLICLAIQASRVQQQPASAESQNYDHLDGATQTQNNPMQQSARTS
jgi:hypothetical protein